MSFLARRVKGPLWAKAGDADRWTRPNFPIELLAELTEKDSKVSFWEVRSSVDPMLKRVAAALIGGSKQAPGREIQEVEFRLVHKSKVTGLGIAIEMSLGDTRDDEVNKLHCELTGMTGPQAISLLRLMDKKAAIVTANNIVKLVALGLSRGNLSTAVLTRDFLWSLHQQGAVKIVVPAK